MVRQSKPASGARILTTKDRQRYFSEPGSQQWLTFLRQHCPANQWTATETKIQGRCPHPAHNDTSPSFVINLAAFYAKCLGCPYHETDPVALVALILGVDYTAALHRVFIVEFGLKVSADQQEALTLFHGIQTTIREVAAIAANLLYTAAHNTADTEYAYAQNAVRYLMRRNIDVDLATTKGVGVFPKPRHLFPHLSTTAKAYMAKAFTVDTLPANPDELGVWGGYAVFPYYTTPDSIGRLKLRGVTKDTQGREGLLGAGSELGFFGLNHFSTLLQNTNAEISARIFIVEGEFDQLSMMQAQYLTYGADTIVVGGSGSAAAGVEALSEYGFKEIVIVGDNDKGGQKFSKTLFREAARAEVSGVYTFRYDAKYAPGADPDDIIQAGLFTQFHADLQNRNGWVEDYEWAAAFIANESPGIEDLDLRGKIDLVHDIADAVREGVTRSLFIERIADILGLDKQYLYQELASSDTEDGFIASLVRALKGVMHPLALRGDYQLVCYSHRTRRIFDFPVQRKRESLLSLQSQVLGMDAFQWVTNTTGIPEFITTDPASKEGVRSLRAQYDELDHYLDRAVQRVASETFPDTSFIMRRQGVHYMDAATNPQDLAALDEGSAAQRLYIVNGLDVFVGEVVDGSQTTTYRALERPQHGGVLFETSASGAWSNNLLTEADINKPVSLEQANEVFAQLLEFFEKGWLFEEQALQVEFFASFAFTMSVSSLFKSMMLLFLHGVTQTGKSTLIEDVFWGKKGSRLQLSEHTVGFDDYTTAGLTQAIAGSALTLCIDEFELKDGDNNSKRSRVVGNTLETFRNISGGVTQTRGSQGGNHRTDFIRSPVIAGGVNSFKDEIDLNRWNLVQMKPKRAHGDPITPAVALQLAFSAEKIGDMRRTLTLFGIQHAPALKQMEAAVYNEVFLEQKVLCREHRFLQALVPSLAVRKLLGVPYLPFAQEYVGAYESVLGLSTLSEAEQLFRGIFHTKSVILPEEGAVPRTVLEVLAGVDTRAMLSLANCGVYWMLGREYVVLYDFLIASAILSKSQAHKGVTNSRTIFQKLLTHKHVIRNPSIIEADEGLLQHLSQFIPKVRATELLLVRLDDLVDFGGFVDGAAVAGISSTRDIV